jgi:hypothetical protein
MRCNESLSPKRAAMLAEAHVRDAFPSRDLWLEMEEEWQWGGVPVRTSAEAAVKYATHGVRSWKDGGSQWEAR